MFLRYFWVATVSLVITTACQQGFKSEATSSTSTATTSINDVCPSGYILIPHNTAVGTTADFCVMKYESKDVSSVATSVSAGTPWVSISPADSKTACTNLGANYDLISNAEWMTIARNAEALAANWTSGTVGSGKLYQGHSDNEAVLAVSDTSDGYDGTSNSSSDGVGTGKEQKRTYVLSNDNIIWDLAGNVGEWVDWTLGGALDHFPQACYPGAWAAVEFPNNACGGITAVEYMPANPAAVNAATYTSTYGLGKIQYYDAAAKNALSRGGSINNTSSGAFYMLLNPTASTWTGTGFRCVYRVP